MCKAIHEDYFPGSTQTEEAVRWPVPSSDEYPFAVTTTGADGGV